MRRVTAATDMAPLLPVVNCFIPVHGPACRASLGRKKWRCIKAEEFDQKFDDGEDVTGDLDLTGIAYS